MGNTQTDREFPSLWLVVLLAAMVASVVLAACSSDGGEFSASRVRVFNFIIEERKLKLASPDILVTEGNTLEITLNTDEAATFNIPTFGVSQELNVASPSTVTFVADQVGDFPMNFVPSNGDASVQISVLKVISPP